MKTIGLIFLVIFVIGAISAIQPSDYVLFGADFEGIQSTDYELTDVAYDQPTDSENFPLDVLFALQGET